MKNILGISAYYHDSAAALLINGNIIACAQEERFTRKKHDPSFPREAIKYVLKEGNIDLKDVDSIVFYEKPFLKFERLLESYLAYAPKGIESFSKAIPLWVKEKLFQKKNIENELKKIDLNFNNKNIKFSEHHLSHAASCFYPSKFEKAAILTLDGVGEWSTSTYGFGSGNDIFIEKDIKFPHSLGLLYSAFTYYLGFKVNSGEYKVMGLAPYGNPIFEKKIYDNLIDIKEDGSFRLNLDYFNYVTGLTMTNEKFNSLFSNKRRNPEEKLEKFHMDIAASIQKVTEEIVKKIVKNLVKTYKIKNLCLAGGVALNCVANGKLLSENIVDNIWIQPAAGDAGGALGAALAYWHLEIKKNRKFADESEYDSMKGSYLGPSYSENEVIEKLNELGANYELNQEDQMINKVAELLKNNNAIGWFQGRMEFGPRALGNRSIIASPISSKMQKNLNIKVKLRESFRPFAPAVLEEDLENYFKIKVSSPYMLVVSEVIDAIKKNSDSIKTINGIEKINEVRSSIPSVTHVDYSARVQTVSRKTNRIFHKLINRFKYLTNCSVLINTSFNIRGEPIVCNVEDAFKCFLGTKLDYLVIGNIILDKKKQLISNNIDYKKKFELD